MKKYLFLVLILIGCNKHNKIEKLLKSNDNTDIIHASYLIGELKDTSFVCDLLSNINDIRITHYYKYYGMTVYQTKVVALKKISGLKPPHEITYKPDTVIINFYKNWAIKHGYNCDK